MGLIEKWRSWILKCTASVRQSHILCFTKSGTNINHLSSKMLGQTSGHISPYLFNLQRRTLAFIKVSIQKNNLHGFKASRSGPPIYHLFFFFLHMIHWYSAKQRKVSVKLCSLS